MTALGKLAVILLPGGCVLLALAWLLRCRHRHEYLCTRAEGMGLRCARCGRPRPHPWANHGHVAQRTGHLPSKQDCGGSTPPVASKLTGIEREHRRQAAEAASSEPQNRARLRVVSRYGETNEQNTR